MGLAILSLSNMSINNFAHHNETMERTDVISHQVTSYIRVALVISTNSFISLFGTFANYINMVVFLKQGVTDSVTVQFFALSFADCMFCLFVLATSITVLFSEVSPNLTVLDPLSLSYCISLSREKLYSLSVIITMFLSVERCVCVMLPFTVKQMFTRWRSTATIVCASIFLAVLLVPEYITEGLAWKHDTRFNYTRLLFWHTKDRLQFDLFKNIVLTGILPVIASVTITVCAIIMIARIKTSTEFRQSKSSTAALSHDSKQTHQTSAQQSNTSNAVLKRNKNLGNRDARMTRAIITVDVIFIVCNIPRCMVLVDTILELCIPKYNYHQGGEYQNLSTVILMVCFAMETVNASVNFFIYLVSSSKFRLVFMEMFCG